MRATVLTVAILVFLSGCGMPQGLIGAENGPTEPEVDGTNTTATSPRETDNTTIGSTIPGPSLSSSSNPEQFLPYSSDFPVSGYLRVNEDKSNLTQSPGLLSASRNFESTGEEIDRGPSQIVVTITLYESAQTAQSDINSEITSHQTSSTQTVVNGTPNQVPIVHVVHPDDGRTISFVQYGSAGIRIESQTDDTPKLSFIESVFEVVIIKINS
ncbi:hypothetical protein PM030_14965 [Halorubrum ezzemoulense]|uniref:hypothetical protein n=1 Tax=Halorubrum ezzemoulense TaxID=337243 RepID=UPI00232DFB58|nr:hypothetical protein [Halorubrum ezzemoulense]MDB2283171.1 hypothetical protein [Halorubrum ezzemoulense]